MTEHTELTFDTRPRIKTLTVNECAEFTGIGQEAIRCLAHDEASGFPYIKIGAKMLIPAIALEEWLLKVSTERRVFLEGRRK